MTDLVRLSRKARLWIIAAPFFWLGIFFLLPFGIVLKISFSEALLAVPPYTEILSQAADGWHLQATLANYRFLFTDNLYVLAFLNSLKIAAISTFICLCIAYPVALGAARASPRTRNLLLLLIVLPSWTSFLIRVYAWVGILGTNGHLNQLLLSLGLINSPLVILRTDLAIYIGIVYTYLPFMVLPLYASLSRLDWRLVEAAADLGARPWRCLVNIVLPLSRPGIVAGCLLVFIPATGEFVIPELLGGPDTLMLGKLIWQEFFSNRDWPLAAAVSMLLLILLLAPIAVYARAQGPGTGAVAATALRPGDRGGAP